MHDYDNMSIFCCICVKGFVGSVRGELLENFESLVMKKAEEELENSSRRFEEGLMKVLEG